MLQAISWGQYLAGAGVLLCCYYLGVISIYYRSEAAGFIKRLSGKAQAANSVSENNTPFREYRSLIHEIDGVLETAGNRATKEELLVQLKTRMAGFTVLRAPAFRDTVFEYIIRHAEEICHVRLSHEELKAVVPAEA